MNMLVISITDYTAVIGGVVGGLWLASLPPRLIRGHYLILKGRGKISMFAWVTVNDSTLVLFLMVKLARSR